MTFSLPPIQLKNGYYEVFTGKDTVKVERCRFHWIGKLLLLFGKTQRVTVQGKTTYVYLPKKSTLTAIFQRISQGKGQDLGDLVTGKLSVPPAFHHLLKTFYPHIPFHIEKRNSESRYDYCLHEVAMELGLPENASLGSFQQALINKAFNGKSSFIYIEEDPYLVLYNKKGDPSHLLPLKEALQNLEDGITLYRSKDLITGQTYAVKLSGETKGQERIRQEHARGRALGKHPHLLKIKKQLPEHRDEAGSLTALISPYYPKGDLTSKTFTSSQILQGMRTTLEALSYIHAQGKYYGDLKKENILLGENDEWILHDFETVNAFTSDECTVWRHSKEYVGKEDEDKVNTVPENELIFWQQTLDVAALALLALRLYGMEIGASPSLTDLQSSMEKAPDALIPLLQKMTHPDYKQRISAQAAIQELNSISSFYN